MTLDRIFLAVGASVVTGVVSAYAAHVVTKKRLEATFDDELMHEIEEAKRFYSMLNKREEYSNVEQVAVKAADLHETLLPPAQAAYHLYSGHSTKPVTTLVEEVSPLTDGTFNYEEELAVRDGTKPYVIHHDEFFAGELEYEQVTLTYFEDDDVLLDEKETPIEDTDNLVGDSNLNRFGHGSKDPNVVYIRNDRLNLDIEVILDKRNYAQEVLGFIEHSEKRGRPRKFRRDYE